MGNKTTLLKAHTKNDSLRVTIPKSVVNQLSLIAGQELSWKWQAKNNELILEVSKIES